MNNSNKSNDSNSNSYGNRKLRLSAIAALAGAAAVMSSCTQLLDLAVDNTCGEPIAFGFHGLEISDDTSWDIVDAGDELILSVDGYDQILVTVVAADAEQVADPVELTLGYLPQDEAPEWTEQVRLDLAGENLCP